MGLYRTVARPVLFSMQPEASHRLAGSLLRLPLPWGLLGGAARDPRAETDLAGIPLANPVGLAAGFDKSATMLHGLTRLGLGYVVIGTVSRLPREGNPRPRVARTPSETSLTNAMGIPNDGVEAVAARLERARPRAPVLASLADEEADDVAAAYARLAGRVAGFELNVSSPNSPWRHSGRDNAAHLREVLRVLVDVRGSRDGPLFVKLPPFRNPDEERTVMELATIGAEGGAQGFTCANTHPVADPRMSTGRGGLSGRPLSAHTPRMVSALRQAFPDLAINASGGVMGPDDLRACLDAGATTVQIYTGLIYEGPRLVRALTRAAVV